MKKNITLAFSLFLFFGATSVFAADTVFDSMGNATEVKLAPAINTSTKKATTTNVSSTTPATTKTPSIKEQKFSSAMGNLDDAQVELRQEIAEVTEKYKTALAEKEKATQNCKALKKQLNALNKNMKNVESAKKNISKNLES
jgi:chromosome segregation ATPase